MADACRKLLDEVLCTAGFSSKGDSIDDSLTRKRTRSLIDLGFGCGDQVIYLMGVGAVNPNNRFWYSGIGPAFDSYIGITLDRNQFQYAECHVNRMIAKDQSLKSSHQQINGSYIEPDIRLFCADAGNPQAWTQELKESVAHAVANKHEKWTLALDTAYHFSPSRWAVINHSCRVLDASFMGFDLCLSPGASLGQMILLRCLTTLLGAPWANFVTPQVYEAKLVEAGYSKEAILIRDISELVFAPLAMYLEQQNQRMQMIGMSIGSFNVAKLMFRWWAKSGIVKGVIIVARKS